MTCIDWDVYLNSSINSEMKTWSENLILKSYFFRSYRPLIKFLDDKSEKLKIERISKYSALASTQIIPCLIHSFMICFASRCNIKSASCKYHFKLKLHIVLSQASDAVSSAVWDSVCEIGLIVTLCHTFYQILSSSPSLFMSATFKWANKDLSFVMSCFPVFLLSLRSLSRSLPNENCIVLDNSHKIIFMFFFYQNWFYRFWWTADWTIPFLLQLFLNICRYLFNQPVRTFNKLYLYYKLYCLAFYRISLGLDLEDINIAASRANNIIVKSAVWHHEPSSAHEWNMQYKYW